MPKNMFNPKVAESTVHDFFSDAKFEIRIREVTLPANVKYLYGAPLTTEDGVNYEMSGEDIKCVLANTVDTTGLTNPKDRVFAAYFTGGFNQNKVEAALGAPLDIAEVRKAMEIQLDIYPWQAAPVDITF